MRRHIVRIAERSRRLEIREPVVHLDATNGSSRASFLGGLAKHRTGGPVRCVVCGVATGCA